MKQAIIGIFFGLVFIIAVSLMGVPVPGEDSQADAIVSATSVMTEESAGEQGNEAAEVASATEPSGLEAATPDPVVDAEAPEGESPQATEAEDTEEIVKPFQPYRIVINLPGYRCRLYENDKLLRVYPICVGHPSRPSPVRKMEITRIIWNPTWGAPPDSAWATGARGAGKMNPMGVVKMLLRGYVFLHGTYKIKSLGFAWSHGCIRMANEDAVELAWFLQTHVGSNEPDFSLEHYKSNRVIYLDQPVPAQTVYETIEIVNGRLLIHPDIYRRRTNTKKNVLAKIREAGLTPNQINMARVHQLMERSRKETAMAPIEDLIMPGSKTVATGETVD